MLSDSPLSPPRNNAVSDDSLSPTSGPLAVVLEEAADDGGGLGCTPLDDNIAVNANPIVPRPSSSAESEKENNRDSKPNRKVLVGKSGKIPPAMSGGNVAAAATRKISPANEPRKTVAKSATKSMSTTISTTTSRTKPISKPPAPGGGARRVLINSVDAPPMRKARKG